MGFCFGFVLFIEMDMSGSEARVYVKCVLVGEPAEVIFELKRRGLVRSVREAVSLGLLCYMERVNDRDLRAIQARAGRDLGE